MKVEEVRNTFNNSERYIACNTSIRVRVSLINNMVKYISFNNILEIGCGDGSIGLSLLEDNRELTLIDISENMIEQAKKNTPSPLSRNVEYIVGDIFKYKPKYKYELVICVGVLAHVPSIEKLLEIIESILSENGHVILQFTESHSLFGWLNYKFMNKTYGGYEVNETCYKDLAPFLLKLKLRMIEKEVYSDSAMLLSRINQNIAYRFKLFTSKMQLPSVFSEVIILLERDNK